MLKEYKTVSQEKTGWRRLFSDENFDLYIWYDRPEGSITGLQLVELSGAESCHALTWEKGNQSFYAGVMNEEPYPFNPSPVLVVNGVFQRDLILRRFRAVDSDLPDQIRQLVRRVILSHQR